MKQMILVVAGVIAGAAVAQTGAGQSSVETARALVGNAPAAPQRLRLVDVPKAAGPQRSLFNGKDLADWEGWLGYADPMITYRAAPGLTPIGRNRSWHDDFAVRSIDGKPAIWVKGETWGALIHKADLRDYHLRLQFKWGPKTYTNGRFPRNNGLLYHTHGPLGAVSGTWSPSMEFEIMTGSTGMATSVGTTVRGRVEVALDPKIAQPHLRYRLGGREIDMVNRTPTWNVEAASDAEKPVGEWNTLDLYVLGDRSVHVVNGVPTAQIRDIAAVTENGTRVPLTHGRIQLQSEGAETFFRNITVEPIRSLPRIVAE